MSLSGAAMAPSGQFLSRCFRTIVPCHRAPGRPPFCPPLSPHYLPATSPGYNRSDEAERRAGRRDTEKPSHSPRGSSRSHAERKRAAKQLGRSVRRHSGEGAKQLFFHCPPSSTSVSTYRKHGVGGALGLSRVRDLPPRPGPRHERILFMYYLYIYLRDRAGARGARGSTYIYSQDQSSTSVSTYRKALGLSRARAWTSTQPQHEGARDTITAPRLRRRKDAERQSLRTQLLPPNRPNAPPPLARRSRARAPRTQTARPRAADGTCRPMHRRRAAAAAQIAAAARRRVAGSAADPGEGRPLRLPSRARAHPHGRGQQSRKRCKRGISYSYIYSL